MKVKVVKRFKDKHNKLIYKVNDVLDITKERYEEILEVGKFVEPVKEEADEKPDEEAADEETADEEAADEETADEEATDEVAEAKPVAISQKKSRKK